MNNVFNGPNLDILGICQNLYSSISAILIYQNDANPSKEVAIRIIIQKLSPMFEKLLNDSAYKEYYDDFKLMSWRFDCCFQQGANQYTFENMIAIKQTVDVIHSSIGKSPNESRYLRLKEDVEEEIPDVKDSKMSPAEKKRKAESLMTRVFMVPPRLQFSAISQVVGALFHLEYFDLSFRLAHTIHDKNPRNFWIQMAGSKRIDFKFNLGSHSLAGSQEMPKLSISIKEGDSKEMDSCPPPIYRRRNNPADG